MTTNPVQSSNRRCVVRGSLRDLLAIPQREVISFADQPMSEAVKRVQASWSGFSADAKPDLEALQFYCLNHLVSMVQHKFHLDERLPSWAADIVKEYVEVVVAQSHRMYTYLMLITTRENRHQHAWSIALVKKHQKKFGEAKSAVLKTFQQTYCKGSDEMKALKNLMAYPPDATLGEYVAHLTVCFNSGSWSGGYGGKAWGKVSQCLEDMIHGRTSLEMMVDSGYALAHNNGPIFNKAMTYQTYSGEFLKILDLQRAGFIPTGVMLGSDGPFAFLMKNEGFKKLPAFCEAVQSEIGGLPEYIDYYKVAAYGVAGAYEYEKKAQVKKYGMPTELVEKPGVTEHLTPTEPDEDGVDDDTEFNEETGAALPTKTKGPPVYLYPLNGTVYSVPSDRTDIEKLNYKLNHSPKEAA